MSPLEAPPAGRGDETSQYAYWLMRTRPDWDVLNRGVNGERSDQVRARFQRDVLDAHPDAVVIIAGVNDVYQGLQPDEVIRHLQWMYERAIQASIRLVAGTIIPFDTATPDQNARMKQVNDWIRTHSQADDRIGFVDTRRAVASVTDPDKLVESADRLHPSPSGYRRMADAIRPVLEAVLR